MTNDNSRKKGISWFKTNNYSQSQSDQNNVEQHVETTIVGREEQLHSMKEHEQLFSANETIGRIKQESMKKDLLLQDKDKEIRGLESSLTNKQMSYDQLLEDYKEYQSTSNIEYENISIQLETEINKYNRLNEESMNSQYQNMLKINEFEEKVRILETENQQLTQQYKKVVDEKSELMQTINDFTERMSFSFSPKATTNSSDPK